MHHASKCELPGFRSLPRFYRVLSTPLEFLTGASKSSRVTVFPGHLAANQRVGGSAPRAEARREVVQRWNSLPPTPKYPSILRSRLQAPGFAGDWKLGP